MPFPSFSSWTTPVLSKGLDGCCADLPQGLCDMRATCLRSCLRPVLCTSSLEWITARAHGRTGVQAKVAALQDNQGAEHSWENRLFKKSCYPHVYAENKPTVEERIEGMAGRKGLWEFEELVWGQKKIQTAQTYFFKVFLLILLNVRLQKRKWLPMKIHVWVLFVLEHNLL